jgi:hypothetical protein
MKAYVSKEEKGRKPVGFRRTSSQPRDRKLSHPESWSCISVRIDFDYSPGKLWYEEIKVRAAA